MKLEILLNPINNCVLEPSEKKLIVITNTERLDFQKYIKSLKNKKSIPNFIIEKNGNIHKLFDDKYYTEFTDNNLINKTSILIALENGGKLYTKDNIQFVNWCYDITTNKSNIIKNNNFYYEKYTRIQIEKLAFLCLHLSKKHNINLNIVEKTNPESKIIDLGDIDYFSDSLNPDFNYDLFNDIINSF
jgi:N-acetyl-anhydromuramyl-L-alanine amidase AmpD